MDDFIEKLNTESTEKAKIIRKIKDEFSKVIVGQTFLFNRMMSAIMSDGHLLLEGVPGLAKTLAISTLSQILDLGFQRIQFTPDMLPADIRGTLIYNQGKGQFDVKKGPVFTNFILADEINRAPAKVQSALLEAMQEHTVTLGDTTHPLPKPFFVMATQNPIEQEGTYALPEAQMDRFYMKVKVDYPQRYEEKEIIRRMGGMSVPKAEKAAGIDDILELREFAEKIYADDKIMDYVVSIVYASRNPKEFKMSEGFIKYGASPRASIAFIRAAKVEAFFDGRGYVIPEDVKAVAYDVLRHRVILSFEAEAEGLTPENMIEQILNNVEIP
ncbi:MAG: ATPase [Spirochaetes bacterium GWF1_51_8]|nr:MAG: ATPase [Spirochaetes bacterium GWF1_51_8]